MLSQNKCCLTSNFAGKRRSSESEKKLVPGSVRTSSELGEGNPTEDLEFPSIQFSDIAVATNNFSKACMIGRGGFGKVYKVLYFYYILQHPFPSEPMHILFQLN